VDHDLHQRIAEILAARGQHYTAARHMVVEALASSGRPATISELLGATPGLAASTAYRNLTVLSEAGVVTRISGAGEFGRFELSEQFSGLHHHHVVCTDCGLVLDTGAPPGLEAALAETIQAAAQANGFDITGHRLELVGRCTSCR
jgi:Fur family transcriptional regulator, ferric uptake regulator